MDYVGILSGLVAVIFSLGVHEAAHGWAAERFGDPTARELGRITLNPIKHIDPIFTIVVPIVLYMTAGFAFGGAKPVPFDPSRFRPGTRVKSAIMWIAAAGPLSNFLLAFVAVVLARAALVTLDGGVTAGPTYRFLEAMVMVNIILGVFNLLPIPPLDGAKVLAGFLPDRLAVGMYKLERFAILFIVLILVSDVTRVIWTPIMWMKQHYESVARVLVGLVA